MASFKETPVVPEQTPEQVAAQADQAASGATRLYATVVEIVDDNGFVRLSIDENGKLTTSNAEGKTAGSVPDFTPENPAFVPAPAPAVDVAPAPEAASAPDVAPPADPAHDQAAAAAVAAVDAAPAAPVDHTQAALDDVNAALVTWPDSTQLQDAKTQLEAQIASN